MKERGIGRRDAIKVGALAAGAFAKEWHFPPEDLESPEINNKTEIIFGGDVMLGRTVMTASLEKNNPDYALANIAGFLRQADIAFVNFENPLLRNCHANKDLSNMTFCTSPELAKSLVDAGVDIVTLANNHTKDYGDEGFMETITELNGLGVESTGYENLVVKVEGEVKFGFAGLDFVTKYDTEEDYEMISRFSKRVDVLIVGVHWGSEYASEPNFYQKRQAMRLVSAGADTIVGHHPHVVQPKEVIEGVPVYFSLGNLIFDQMWEETRRGLLVRQVYDGNTLVKDELLETYMDDWAQPVVR